MAGRPLRERVLYHQIHPLKLAVDWCTAFIAAYLLWQHHLWLALLIGWIPSIIVSAALLRWADLEPYAQSAFGKYVSRYMTRRMEALRFAGLAVFWVSAWTHSWIGMAAGVVVILAAWMSGLAWSGNGRTAG